MCPGVAVQFKLHSVWDNWIGLDYAGIAAKLRAEFTDEDRARWIPQTTDTEAVVAWANKSSAIAERPDVQYCIPRTYSPVCQVLHAESHCRAVMQTIGLAEAGQ